MARQSNAFYDDGTELSPLDSPKHIDAQIAAYLGRMVGISSSNTAPTGTGLPVVVTPPSGTLHGANLTATGAVTIPIGAFNVGIILSTGTGTYTTAEGTIALVVGQPINFADKLAAACTVTMGSPGTGSYNYLV